MSVLVKNMKMPENCERCPIREGTFCDIINKDIDRFYSGSVKRDPDCPLVEIPTPHGRLIDADALNLEYEVEMADDWKTAHEIANCVKYASTIIEAEE